MILQPSVELRSQIRCVIEVKYCRFPHVCQRAISSFNGQGTLSRKFSVASTPSRVEADCMTEGRRVHRAFPSLVLILGFNGSFVGLNRNLRTIALCLLDKSNKDWV